MTIDMQQMNQAINDIYDVYCQLPIEAQEFLLQKIIELLEERNHSSVKTVSSFKTIHELALRHGINTEESSILEIGAGKPLGMGILWNYVGAEKYSSIDKFVQVNVEDLWVKRFQSIVNANLFNPRNFNISNLLRKSGAEYFLNRERIDLIQGDFYTYPFPQKAFNFIYSFAVLEHVADVATILKKMHGILSDDGIMIHLIDLREHHTHLRTVPDKNTSIEYLKYSKAQWEAIYPPGSEHYINRLRASDFERLFNENDFEIIELSCSQRMEVDDSLYQDINEEFKQYSLDDLGKIAIKAVLKKR